MGYWLKIIFYKCSFRKSVFTLIEASNSIKLSETRINARNNVLRFQKQLKT